MICLHGKRFEKCVKYYIKYNYSIESEQEPVGTEFEVVQRQIQSRPINTAGRHRPIVNKQITFSAAAIGIQVQRICKRGRETEWIV